MYGNYAYDNTVTQVSVNVSNAIRKETMMVSEVVSIPTINGDKTDLNILEIFDHH